jgi:tetratricopeptide (TPR) repeat protein
MGLLMGRSSLRVLETEARRLRRQENWGEEAIEVNSRILSLDPSNTAALNRRARCHIELMDLGAAEDDYRRASALDPGNKNIEKAIREIEERVRIERAHEEQIEEIRSIGTFARAYAVGRENKNKSPDRRRLAVEALRRAFRLDKTKTGVLIELAVVHRSLRQRDEAERIYDWILRREHNSAAKVGLAALYKDKKRLRDALRLCDEVLAEEPRNPYALRCRASILSELDRGAEAMESFGKSLDQP